MNSPPRILLIDIGNSNIKWTWDAERIAGSKILPHTSTARLTEGLDRHWGSLDIPKEIFVSCVAPSGVLLQIQQWIEENWNRQLNVVMPAAKAFGVTNGYDNPSMLGSDRWLAMIAAHHKYRGDLCIVDCGSAITLDILEKNGLHKGGAIMPGFRLMRDVLVQQTGINKLSLNIGAARLGKNTAEGVSFALLQAACGMVERIYKGAQKQLGSDMLLLLTGNDAHFLKTELDIHAEISNNLVMQGLSIVAGGTGS
jgi:type III pantothenate kinase